MLTAWCDNWNMIHKKIDIFTKERKSEFLMIIHTYWDLSNIILSTFLLLAKALLLEILLPLWFDGSWMPFWERSFTISSAFICATPTPDPSLRALKFLLGLILSEWRQYGRTVPQVPGFLAEDNDWDSVMSTPFMNWVWRKGATLNALLVQS